MRCGVRTGRRCRPPQLKPIESMTETQRNMDPQKLAAEIVLWERPWPGGIPRTEQQALYQAHTSRLKERLAR